MRRRHTIENLLRLPTDFRITRHGADYGFPTRDSATEEDFHRGVNLKSFVARNPDVVTLWEDLQLAARLMVGTGDPPPTLASKRYVRDQFIRLGAQLNRIIDTPSMATLSLISIRSSDFDLRRGQLHSYDPRKSSRRVAKIFTRPSGANANGGLLGFFQLKANAERNRIECAIRAIAYGEMVHVAKEVAAEALNQSPRSLSVRVDQGYNLTGALTAISNLIADSWRTPQWAIREALHWLDKWSLDDLALQVHVSARDGNLINWNAG